MEIKKTKFKFSGKVARLLGRESVSDPIIALTELIKNSYDADASYCKIVFRNIKSGNGSILIKDDGKGMSYEEFENKWMVVGTDDKEVNRVSVNGRAMVGEKGIGRFAVETLAKKISLNTKIKGSNERLNITINWDVFEQKGILFDMIEIPVEINEDNNIKKHNFFILLEGLRDEWDNEGINKLEKEIGLIIPPEVFKDKFRIIIDAKEFEIVEKKIESKFLEDAVYKFSANLEDNGEIEYRIKRIDEGTVIEKSLNKNFTCGPVKFTLYFYYRKGFKKYRIFKIKDITNFLDEFSGVRIYKDGFQVKPFGDPGNDWLELSAKRLWYAKRLVPDNTQVIGFIEISSEKNRGIISTTTREGVKQNRPFKDLKKFIIESIWYFADYRKDRRRNLGIEKKVVSVDEKKEKLNIFIDRLNLPSRDTKELKNLVSSISLTVEDQEEEAIDTKKLYRNLATLGISTAVAAHEINAPVSTALSDTNFILEACEEDDIDSKEIHERAESLHYNMERIKEFNEFISTYSSKSKRRKNHQNLEEIATYTLDGYSPILDRLKIQVEKEFEKDLDNYFIYRGDFESIFTNFVTNSLEHLKKIENNRKIKVTIKKPGNSLIIKFSNNGPSIDKNDRTKIFQPFWTTKKDGSGLGLTIVKEIVEDYDGSVNLESSGPGDGASFIIKIPEKELLK